jgi:transcriptional regulator with XRE-family HTH domain
MEDGAASPHVGSRIREIRAWRDVSLRAVAELASVSPGFLSMVENGERVIQQRKHLEAIARALRVSPTELGALPTTGVLDPDVSRALDGLVDVEAALTDVQLGEQTVTPRPWEAVRADVEHLQAVLRPRADIAAQMQMLPQVIRELNALSVVDPANRQSVLKALIHVLHSAAMAAKYVGAHGTPGLGALRMREVAEELDEPSYLGLARFARAQTLGSGGRERMRELSISAADDLQPHIDGERSRQLYGMLHLNAALASAALSDGDGALSHLAEARETAERAPDPEGTGWACLSFNRTNVRFWECTLAIELGEPGRVGELRESIVPEQMVSWSRQGAYHADLGRALAVSKGTRYEAVMALVRAEQLSPVSTRANVWVRETVRDLLLRVKRDAPVGRELRGMAYRMGLAA